MKILEEFTIEDNIDEVRQVAKFLVKKWKPLFEVDELVNEAWLKLRDKSFSSIGRLQTAARCDMIDYIRFLVGRKWEGKKYSNGTPMKDTVKILHISATNTISAVINEEDKEFKGYEKQNIDPRFKAINDQDLIDTIFKDVEINEKEKDVFIRRYMHSTGPKQIAE